VCADSGVPLQLRVNFDLDDLPACQAQVVSDPKQPADLAAAMRAWGARLGAEAVLTANAAQRCYGSCTTGIERSIAAALRPQTLDEVVAAVRIAAEFHTPLYPISTGKNWGYGSAVPPQDGCVVVDLSGLDRIVDMDPVLGLVTVEPGVTQHKLCAYLDGRQLPFLVPVTGAGPDCSLVGNALERGYGITPHADHFGAVTALEAVLPDGQLYRSALTELGGAAVDQAFKWGIGPYLDGLFAQSGWGIVTRMTIALARRPERIQAFLFAVEPDAGLEAAVTAVQRVLREVGGVVGPINLMNARRMLAMTVPYPYDRVDASGVLPAEAVADLAAGHRLAAWTGFGALYGNRAIVNAAATAVRRILKPISRRLRFVTPASVAAAERWLGRLPGLRNGPLVRQARTLNAAMQLVSGRPSRVSLPLAYWRAVRPAPASGDLNPARDGCGLIWYSPLVPMTPARVRRYVVMVHEHCAAHQIEPLITLTSLSERCFDSSVPLLFDRADAAATARAQACYAALLEGGKNEGFLPYRIGVQAMGWLARPGLPYWDMIAALKTAIDPRGIFSPGRYGP
jgi:4-cresol dehydrogenase (hydroxylating)